MIPKIIHYCWLSKNPIPENVKGYMATWKEYLPDYEFVLWNFDRFDRESSVWVKQACAAGKYAFAADYIRLYALYHYGGIYLDVDVQVVKPFDDLLDLPYFLGKELSNEDVRPEAGIVGAEKGCCWIKKCLDYYENRAFITEEGKPDIVVLPQLMQHIIAQNFGFRPIADKSEFDMSDSRVCIFPAEFFSPKNHETSEINQTLNTYSILHFAGSWLQDKTFSKVSKKLTLDDLLNEVDVEKLMMPMSAAEVENINARCSSSACDLGGCQTFGCVSSGGCTTSSCTDVACLGASNCSTAACSMYACATISNDYLTPPTPTPTPSPTPTPTLIPNCSIATYKCEGLGCETYAACTNIACQRNACTSYGYSTPIPPLTPLPTCRTSACKYYACYSNACITLEIVN